MIRVVAWNLMHGGGPTRTAGAAVYLAQSQADIVVLTEFRSARGSQLRGVLADAGLGFVEAAPPSRGGNTVAIASRWTLTDAGVPHGAPAGRALSVGIPSLGIDVLGVHVPDESSTSARDRAWDATLRWARDRRAGLNVIAGDFNTSRAGVDPPREGQTCEHCLGVLETLGFTDAWRRAGRGATGVSWHGPNGERQRLDAAFVSAGLAKTIESALYDGVCVEEKLSDHAPLVVTLNLSAPPQSDRQGVIWKR